MKRLHASTKLGSYSDREEFQVERVIVWVNIPPHGDRTIWLERADRIFGEVWRAIPDVVSVARLGLSAPEGDLGRSHDEMEVASERLAVMGIWIDPINGSAEYEVGADYGCDGVDLVDPSGIEDSLSVMVYRDPDGELTVNC
jgi:hypothetical protein